MNIKLTKTERLLLCGGLIGMASLMLQACDIMAKKTATPVTESAETGKTRKPVPTYWCTGRENHIR